MKLSFRQERTRLTTDYVLNCVGEETIYRAWYPRFKVGMCKSPFHEDKNESLSFFRLRGRIKWRDHSRDESGDVFDFVQKLEGLTTLTEAVERVAQAFQLQGEREAYVPTYPQYRPGYQSKEQAPEAATPALIQAVRRPWGEADLKWWNRLNINQNILELYHTGVAEEVWLYREGWPEKRKVWTYSKESPIYFYFNPHTNRIQCYRPMEKTHRDKWMGNLNQLRDIHGYHQCEIKRYPGRPLLLVKSRKDVMFFRSFGFNAMAGVGEMASFDPDFIRHLRKYCGPILYIGDNDAPGIRRGMKIRRDFGIPTLYICEQWGGYSASGKSLVKDPTDLWLQDYHKCYDLLNLINDYIRYYAVSGTLAPASTLLRAA
jgi:hypothetical protein